MNVIKNELLRFESVHNSLKKRISVWPDSEIIAGFQTNAISVPLFNRTEKQSGKTRPIATARISLEVQYYFVGWGHKATEGPCLAVAAGAAYRYTILSSHDGLGLHCKHFWAVAWLKNFIAFHPPPPTPIMDCIRSVYKRIFDSGSYPTTRSGCVTRMHNRYVLRMYSAENLIIKDIRLKETELS